MPVFLVGRKPIDVGWFLSQMFFHFPVAGPSKSLKLCKCLICKINQSSISPSGLSSLMRYVNMPNYKGSKMFIFQLTFGNNDILGVVVLMFCLCWLFRAGELEIQNEKHQWRQEKDISIQISGASIIIWQNCSGERDYSLIIHVLISQLRPAQP